MMIVVDGIIFQDQGAGGISRIFHEVLPRLCALDEAVEIVVMTSGKVQQPLPHHARIRHIDVLPVSDVLRPRRFWLGIHDALRRRLMARQLVVRQVDVDATSIWLSTYYTRPPSNWPGKEVVLVYDMIHEQCADLFTQRVDIAFSARKQHAVEAADRVICISETTRQDVLAAYAVEADRVQVAYLAHSALFKRAAGQVNALFPEPFVLYVGSRTHYKNFDFLLEAYAGWARRDAVHLVVVGGCWTKAEERLLQQYALLDRVHLFSGVSDEQLAVFYQTALAFVYPSRYEGFGIPLLEAMACGCPVVASDIPAFREITDGCAFYFDPSSPESLHEALERAMQPEAAGMMVKQAVERAAQFSWEDSGHTILALLRQLAPD